MRGYLLPVALSAVVLLAGCGGPTAPAPAEGASFNDSALGGLIDAPTAAAAPATARKATFGEAVDAYDSEGKRVGTMTVAGPGKTYAKEPGEFGSTPSNGQFIIYQISAQADAGNTGAWTSHVYDFYVRTTEGDRYDASVLTEAKPTFQGGSLNAGERQRGNIGFDVPKGQSYTLVYAPGLMASAQAEWPTT